MPMGFAIVNAPFFIIGHIYAIAFDYECNGYSLPYYLSIRISTIFYVSLACSMLILIISQFSNFLISFLSVFLMLFGTNLLNYTIYQPGMSHAFSFSFSVFFIFSMLSWINKANLKGFLLMCFLFGLLVLIRPTNLFFGVFPVLYTVRNYNDFTSRFKLLFWNIVVRQNYKNRVVLKILFDIQYVRNHKTVFFKGSLFQNKLYCT